MAGKRPNPNPDVVMERNVSPRTSSPRNTPRDTSPRSSSIENTSIPRSSFVENTTITMNTGSIVMIKKLMSCLFGEIWLGRHSTSGKLVAVKSSSLDSSLRKSIPTHDDPIRDSRITQWIHSSPTSSRLGSVGLEESINVASESSSSSSRLLTTPDYVHPTDDEYVLMRSEQDRIAISSICIGFTDSLYTSGEQSGRRLHHVMEYSPFGDLQQVIARSNSGMSQYLVARLLAPIARGLSVSHDIGFAQGDISPENLLLVSSIKDANSSISVSTISDSNYSVPLSILLPHFIPTPPPLLPFSPSSSLASLSLCSTPLSTPNIESSDTSKIESQAETKIESHREVKLESIGELKIESPAKVKMESHAELKVKVEGKTQSETKTSVSPIVFSNKPRLFRCEQDWIIKCQQYNFGKHEANGTKCVLIDFGCAIVDSKFALRHFKRNKFSPSVLPEPEAKWKMTSIKRMYAAPEVTNQTGCFPPAVDVFALGSTMLALIADSPAFKHTMSGDKQDLNYTYMIQTGKLPPLHASRCTIRFSNFVIRMCHPDWRQRPSMHEVAVLLESYLDFSNP